MGTPVRASVEVAGDATKVRVGGAGLDRPTDLQKVETLLPECAEALVLDGFGKAYAPGHVAF